ncbi:polysaccharide deacetylase family protein [Xanthomonas sp. NCPPB 2654]|uniref:polysaccharide deacetylase family protein n=1 Tax=unclassified Xanthomonas TaxID=2643310 RepID=UPI0021E0F6C5|nr:MULTISPECIES: polysaccharide deacetylase family protein [unclassified Xanthomonas]MDL5366551.1 polysaccharide deacetylase family protein [Xanthomonas sp. NCPPB 2654]UYC21306.1 polysaccharide deacetylase family protein [Xanthomonas sp. CFBP 8443]
MKRYCRYVLLAVLAVLAVFGAAQVQAQESDRRIAVTIDDLPWQRMGETPAAQLPAFHAQLMASLRQADVPIVGFVNEDKLEQDGHLQPQRVAMLRDWLDAGYELGNHTYGHVNLHDVGLPAYEDAIVRGERSLRPLLAEYGQQLRWFRHPYLATGRSAADREAVVAFVAARGYRIAPVTVDNSEWVWAFAYARVLETEPQGAAREATLLRLRKGYVPYMLNKLDYYEAQSQQLFGRRIAQVWLMHANELNAVAFPELIAATRRRGYAFVTLDEALRDPAYRHAEGYTGGGGISWLHRWAMADHKPKDFYAGEPLVPAWVSALAGLESE